MRQGRIAIVEDEASHADLLTRHIESWQRQQDMVKLHVRRFRHSAEFFFSWEEESFDMIFLDIQMPGINGMETARRIRETDSSVKLVFTTGITDYLQEGYEVEAIRYLLKPITREKVWQCLDKLLQEPVRTPLLMFQSMEGVVKIPEQEVEYLEARGHYTICHLRPGGRKVSRSGREQGREVAEQTRSGVKRSQGTSEQYRECAEEIQLKESFNALCEKLSPRPFVRCHRSYLCSIARIYRVERTEILLESGESIPLSRRMYEPVTKAFISYFRREGEVSGDFSEGEERETERGKHADQ